MWVLGILRAYYSLQRRLFGRTLPHWLKDASAFVKFVNVARVLPTFLIMVLCPTHFFKIIPIIIKGKKPYFMTPIEFLSKMAIIEIVLFLAPKNHIEATTLEIATIVNLVLAIFSPIVVIFGCCFIWLLWRAAVSIPPVSFLASRFRFNYHALLIPILPSSYINLKWGRFFWSMTYYYWYFYITTIALVFVVFVTGYFIGNTYVEMDPGGQVPINNLTVAPGVLAGLFIATAGHRILIAPYIYMLMMCGKQLSDRMMKYIQFKLIIETYGYWR